MAPLTNAHIASEKMLQKTKRVEFLSAPGSLVSKTLPPPKSAKMAALVQSRLQPNTGNVLHKDADTIESETILMEEMKKPPNQPYPPPQKIHGNPNSNENDDENSDVVPEEPIANKPAESEIEVQKKLLPSGTGEGEDPESGKDIEKSVKIGGSGEVQRGKWANKVEFLLAVIGFAVDLGNVWRFPYICYRNGGGAFLIPYFVMFFCGGLPLFFMELAMGQYHRTGCMTIWNHICPLFKGIGLAICVVTSYMAWYYNTIIAYSAYFFFSSFAHQVPWRKCGNIWNTDNCTEDYYNGTRTNWSTSPSEEYFRRRVLQVHLADGMDDIGTIRGELALCLFFVFFVVYFALWKGPSSSGKAVWITATMPYVVLFILLIRGVTLPGAMDGLKYFITPKWHLLTEKKVWVDAATQIFFSLGPGFGVLLALSSYNDFHNNCLKDAMVTSLINSGTSLLSGLVIFSTLGYMAKVLDKDVSDVAGEGGPGLIFVVYPQAIATMTGSPFWALIFFFMLFTLGIDSTFGGLEAMITAFCDQFPKAIGRRRELFVLALCVYCYLGGLATTTHGGQYLIEFLDYYGVTFSLLFIVAVETIAVCWCYGIDRFTADVTEMLGYPPPIYWRFCWRYVSPIFIIVIFGFACTDATKQLTHMGYEYPPWTVLLGWTIRLSSILMIPGFAIYKLLSLKGPFKTRLRIALGWQPDPDGEIRSRPKIAVEGSSEA